MRHLIVSSLLLIYLMGPGIYPSCALNRSAYIETVGTGVPDPSITNETQRKATARDAALADAQARMLALLQNGASSSSAGGETFKSGILKGAYVVKTHWARDGSCQVTLRLKKPK